MITHKIERYTFHQYQPQFPIQPHVGSNTGIVTNLNNLRRIHPMQKHEFNAFIAELPYQKGDFIVYKNSQPPWTVWQVSKIMDIDESTIQVSDWGSAHTGPYVLHVVDHNSPRIRKNATNDYRRIEPEQVPLTWKTLWERST